MKRIKDVLPRQTRPAPRPWLAAQWLAAAATGAAFTYFLDPEQGGSRRAMARDRVAALMRRGARGAARWAWPALAAKWAWLARPSARVARPAWPERQLGAQARALRLVAARAPAAAAVATPALGSVRAPVSPEQAQAQA